VSELNKTRVFIFSMIRARAKKDPSFATYSHMYCLVGVRIEDN